jgi:hypothetical protein
MHLSSPFPQPEGDDQLTEPWIIFGDQKATGAPNIASVGKIAIAAAIRSLGSRSITIGQNCD